LALKIERVRWYAKASGIVYLTTLIGWNLAWWFTGIRSFTDAHYGTAAVFWLSVVWMPLALGFIWVRGWHLKEEAKDMKLSGDKILAELKVLHTAIMNGDLEVVIEDQREPPPAVH
jgi:hypothetical protein